MLGGTGVMMSVICCQVNIYLCACILLALSFQFLPAGCWRTDLPPQSDCLYVPKHYKEISQFFFTAFFRPWRF